MHYVVLGCLKWFTLFIFQTLTINVVVVDYDKTVQIACADLSAGDNKLWLSKKRYKFIVPCLAC